MDVFPFPSIDDWPIGEMGKLMLWIFVPSFYVAFSYVQCRSVIDAPSSSLGECGSPRGSRILIAQSSVHMGVPWNGGIPKWWVKNGKSHY